MIDPMASCTAKLLLLAVAALCLAAGPASGRWRPVRLRFYMHDIVGGPGQTSMVVLKGPGPPNPSMSPGNCFGDTVAVDDVLTEGPSLSTRAVGRAQGTYMLGSLRRPVFVVSITAALTEGPYNGSTILVAGRDDTSEEVRELAVVGGTGRLRRASGHVLWRTAEVVSKLHAVLELDVHAWVPVPVPTTTTTTVMRRSAQHQSRIEKGELLCRIDRLLIRLQLIRRGK